LRVLGNYNPDFILGFANQISYKGLTLGFLFDWRYGGTIVSRTLAIGSTSGVLENTLPGRETGIIGQGLKNIGTTANPQYVPNDVVIPALNYYNQYYDRDNEANALYSASYLKLRQLSLSYQLPNTWAQKMRVAGATVSLIGNNLAVWTENPNVDPELSAMQGRRFAYGVEDMSYPSSRSWGFSLKLRI
jgi:hypothetical protein